MTPSKNHQANVAAARQTYDAINALLMERADFEQERQGLSNRIGELQSMPVSTADAKQFMFDMIDKGAEQFIKQSGWPGLFERVARPQTAYERGLRASNQRKDAPAPLSLKFIDEALAADWNGLRNMLDGANDYFFLGRGDTPLPIHSAPRFYFFFGDQIKAKIGQHMDKLYPQYGAEANPADSITERRQTIAGLQERCTRIDAELSRIDGQLAELGHRK